MKDIRHYSNDELSLRVFNDEYFYIERNHREYLIALINEEFYYTDEQMEILINDLDEEME